MFERPHHRRIATILQALDADALLANACLFGGGTAMALRFGEYRESVDIGFLVRRQGRLSAGGARAAGGAVSGVGVNTIERPAARPH